MEKGKSAVWKYFKTIKEDDKKAECLQCKEEKVVIVRGKTIKTCSTTPLWNHLEAKHFNLFKEAKSKKNDIAESTPENNNVYKQPTLEHVIKKTENWTLEDPRSKDITKLICEMMALDCEPFNLVEREGFCRLIKHLAPRYPLPSRTYFSENKMPETYEKLRNNVKQKLLEMDFISFTTDIWTSTTNNESFISLTGHCLNSNNMEQHIFTLATKHFAYSHTGTNICEILREQLDAWGITKEKMHVVVSDNAPNMISGIGLMGVERVACFIHTLQLAIHDAIFVEKSFVEILGKCRKIVGHFNHSTLACSKLKEIQKKLKTPDHKMIQDVSTRWNSTYYMLSRLHEQKQAVTVYAAEYDIPTLSAHEWSIVENVIHVLNPFEELTKQASLDRESLAYVIPSVAALNSFLLKRCNNGGLEQFKMQLKQSLNERFLTAKGLNIQQRQCFVVATLLDPRFKNRFLNDMNTAKKWVTDELIEADRAIREQTVVEIEEPTLTVEVSKSIDEIAHKDIWDCFEELANGSSSEADSSICSDTDLATLLKRQGSDRTKKKNRVYELELEKYIKLPLLPRQEDPLIWWRQNFKEFPNLKKIALKYLCAPPSSVNSERLFSAAGSVYSDNRNRLLPDNAEKLLFIMKNLKIFDFKY